MKLIVNCSNLNGGGGIQVAVSFIKELINFSEHEYHIFLGFNILHQINLKEYSYNFHFYNILYSPSSLKYAYLIIKQLRKLENEIKPDCVFTLFGPSYWTPKSPHLLGYAQGYYLYPESPFFRLISLFKSCKISLLKSLHRFFFRRNSKYFFVESMDAKIRLASFLNVNIDNISVISNTYNSVFNQQINRSCILPPKAKDEIRLVTISSYYRHKNLEIIVDVIAELKKITTLKCIFVITIDPSIYKRKFIEFEESIINLGPVPVYLCPKIYQECDFVFLPTLVEIFSASYPEAMKMKKPILTSDLSFAHEICRDAAEYFNPLNSAEIAKKIIELANNGDRQFELICKGEKRLLELVTPKNRAEEFLNICKNICTGNVFVN